MEWLSGDIAWKLQVYELLATLYIVADIVTGTSTYWCISPWNNSFL